jgi:ppGpp synthetase/RelA/SpoT-type nucleotidyltranferase
MITSQQNDANLSDRKIEKYEKQTTQLYNEKSNLEQQLETTTDENAKNEINNRIKDIDNQIADIDKKINQWNNTKEEINKYLEEQKATNENLPATQQQESTTE